MLDACVHPKWEDSNQTRRTPGEDCREIACKERVTKGNFGRTVYSF